jgi:hypothetical protein
MLASCANIRALDDHLNSDASAGRVLVTLDGAVLNAPELRCSGRRCLHAHIQRIGVLPEAVESPGNCLGTVVALRLKTPGVGGCVPRWQCLEADPRRPASREEAAQSIIERQANSAICVCKRGGAQQYPRQFLRPPYA